MALFGGSNWVERKKQASQQLSSRSESLWHEVKAAIEDASRSFNELYSKELDRKSSIEPTNDHRVRISVQGGGLPRTRTVDVEFDRDDKTLKANSHENREITTFMMTADFESAFIIQEDSDERISPDEISRRILEPILFGENTGSAYRTRGLPAI
jgi:hypothetical protein